MTSNLLEQVAELLTLHDEAFKDYLNRHNDGHKSSEGSIDISFGNFWDRDGYDKPGALGKPRVSVYSYALGPSRQHYFDSIEEAITEVRKWKEDQLDRPDYGDLGPYEFPEVEW